MKQIPFVDFIALNEPFEVQFGLIEIVLGGNRLVFPLRHLLFVEVIGCVHLLEVNLELVFVKDGDAKMLDAYLVAGEALAEGREVHVTVPLCVVC
jgi:hypothetical protein